MFDLFHIFRILSWRAWQAQMAGKWLRYNLFILFESDIEADQPTSGCIT